LDHPRPEQGALAVRPRVIWPARARKRHCRDIRHREGRSTRSVAALVAMGRAAGGHAMSNQKGRLTGRVLKFGARLFTIRTMVRVVAYGLVALAACLLLCANVYAQRQLSKAATAGRDTFLEGYSAADNNCQGLDPPEIIIDQPPEHGFVCLRRGDSLLKTTI